MDKQKNVYTLSETIVDAEGKKHKVYPMPLKYNQEVVEFMSEFNDDYLFFRFMMPKLDEDGVQERDQNGKPLFDQQFLDDLLGIIEIALRFKETKEQILQWIDLGLAKEIIVIFLDLSQLKKKNQMSL